ncbi:MULTISPECIES: AraC family transcriptional regulator [unclassified Arthrobacter]|uniref:AraC family transcriptional regulator n=1 Tax=unclassified Arthrobacter TaxID=235627 RepID=UPI001D152145|nr:AraC family transcriptional regulator [Arthrobacter sp. zg-Y1110]MCC3289915.1 AraC family transcriptional regulator [Arthrobacter sp. zg-Y1110]MCC3300573.1 AraC family transcriptional regulator [Arthrobacter sp. zg-Y895]UWX84677.1 AraC family transcriptional regulator [Arthrobacter sp. zg-Y1110]
MPIPVPMNDSAPLGTPEGARRTSRFSTAQAPLRQRLDLWEEYNEQALFGLRCSTLSERSLLATQTNLALPRIRLTHINGNDHVIERAPENIRRNPVDAVMLCLLLEGKAFFYHDAGCETLAAGEAVVYDANRPFMYGFSTDMRQVIVEVPRTVLREQSAREEYFRPRVLRIAGSPAATHANTTANAVLGAFRDPVEDTDELERSVLEMFSIITGEPGAAPSLAYLAAARDYIGTHLGRPALSLAQIARAVGISERHLTRVFAEAGTSPARYVLETRLTRAQQLLADPAHAATSIAAIAASVGFVSAAHFSRAFRLEYGCTPRDARLSAAARQAE